MRNGLLIIAPLGALTVRTRLFKLARQAHEMGLAVGHWGWARYMPAKDAKTRLGFDLADKRMLVSNSSKGRWSRLLYPLWVMSVFVALVFRKRPRKVYCLGLETALPAWMASFFSKIDYVFDDADRLVMIQPMPAFLRKLVTRLERRVSAKAMVHIIPGRDRYDYETDRQKIVRNTPNAVDLGSAFEMDVPEKPGPFVIYANGWLGETRGLPVVNALAKHFANDDRVHFMIAGRIDGPSATEAVTLPNVTYFGEVTSAQALAYARIADVLVTLYDPSIEINRYAESNKWGDAIFVGLPVLVNDEVVTSRFLQDAGAAFTFPYNDTAAAIEVVTQLIENPQQCEAARAKVIALREQLKHFDDEMALLLEGLK